MRGSPPLPSPAPTAPWAAGCQETHRELHIVRHVLQEQEEGLHHAPALVALVRLQPGLHVLRRTAGSCGTGQPAGPASPPGSDPAQGAGREAAAQPVLLYQTLSPPCSPLSPAPSGEAESGAMPHTSGVWPSAGFASLGQESVSGPCGNRRTVPETVPVHRATRRKGAPRRPLHAAEAPASARTVATAPRELGSGCGGACAPGTHPECTLGNARRPAAPEAPEPGPHLQQEADLVHALVLRDESPEEQVERLHGLPVQHLPQDGPGGVGLGRTLPPPRGGAQHPSRQGPRVGEAPRTAPGRPSPHSASRGSCRHSCPWPALDTSVPRGLDSFLLTLLARPRSIFWCAFPGIHNSGQTPRTALPAHTRGDGGRHASAELGTTSCSMIVD